MSDHELDMGPVGKGFPAIPACIDPPPLAEEIRHYLAGKRIEAAIPTKLRKQGLHVEEYERIGGLTNRNYKLNHGQDAVVLRLPGWGTGRFIDRSSERANQEAAARAGFTPQSLYFDARTGVKITRYFHDAKALHAEEAKRPECSAEVAFLLARFHSSGVKFVKAFNVFAMARTYERVAHARLARFYDGFIPVRARVLALEDALSSIGVIPVACHNDLVPENILRTPSGLTLIDWEYSGMNDPAWDLASFLLESSIEAQDAGPFLATYAARMGQEGDPGLLHRIEAYKLLQDYLWSLWSLLQEGASRRPERARYYRSYGLSRYQRAIARLPEVERSFGIVQRLLKKKGR